MTKAVHWIGAGLASAPGIIALVNKLGKLTVWDMELSRAESLKAEVTEGELSVAQLDLGDDASVLNFTNHIHKGDVIVSMLPAFLHVRMAEIALTKEANLVTSSYLSSEMVLLEEKAKKAGVALVNEAGLDPGIDHLFAHILVAAAKDAGVLGRGHHVEFVSHCGGIPAEATEFTYKFSWTPLGVLTALKNSARYIYEGKTKDISRAWEAVSELDVLGEVFEVYPNRNSMPYIKEYGLDKEPGLSTFVRGTLRMGGWKKAWADIFTQVENASENDLKALSEKLWNEHTYSDGEEDRVVLYVGLKVKDEAGSEWQASLALDEVGSGLNTAMARTVSLTVAEAVKAVLRDEFKPGVHAATENVAHAKLWLEGLAESGIKTITQGIEI